jgi:hypothetical protein
MDAAVIMAQPRPIFNQLDMDDDDDDYVVEWRSRCMGLQEFD